MLHEEDGHRWTPGNLYANIILRGDKGSILQVEAIELNKFATTSTGIVRKETTLLDVKKAPLNYTEAFSI